MFFYYLFKMWDSSSESHFYRISKWAALLLLLLSTHTHAYVFTQCLNCKKQALK